MKGARETTEAQGIQMQTKLHSYDIIYNLTSSIIN